MVSVRSDPNLPGRFPLYVQVRNQIATAIEQGEWEVGESLPNEFELARAYSVSQGTVRKGLDLLVAEGVLTRRQGVGTFVSATEEDWGAVIRRMDDARSPMSMDLLACARGHASEEAAAMLDLRRGAPLIVVKRLLRVDGEPFGVIESAVSVERFDGLDARRIKQADCNLGKVWWREFGLRVMPDAARYAAVPADREEARLLSVEFGQPLLEVARLARGLDGGAVEWAVLHCRTDRHAYTAVPSQASR